MLLDRIIGIIPIQPSQREARIEWLVEYAVETRRAALEEASIAVKKLFDEAQPQSAAYYTACLDIDLALDRLREGVEG